MVPAGLRLSRLVILRRSPWPGVLFFCAVPAKYDDPATVLRVAVCGGVDTFPRVDAFVVRLGAPQVGRDGPAALPAAAVDTRVLGAVVASGGGIGVVARLVRVVLRTGAAVFVDVG